MQEEQLGHIATAGGVWSNETSAAGLTSRNFKSKSGVEKQELQKVKSANNAKALACVFFFNLYVHPGQVFTRVLADLKV